jgi:hypothetical protein
MKPRQVLGQYLEVYGQLSPITPEARKKKAPFLPDIKKHLNFDIQLRNPWIVSQYSLSFENTEI